MKKHLAFLLLIQLISASGHRSSCATFQNLDFESASLVPVPGGFHQVYADSALPHWTGYSGTNELSAVLYNDTYLASTGIAILDSDWRGGWPYAGLPLQGNFSVLLQAGADLQTLQPADLSLTQTGLVPSNARSLWFSGQLLSEPQLAPQFAISLGGVALDLFAFPGGTSPATLYGADISAFAGQTLPLDFTLFAPRPFGQVSLYLDSIQFSPTPVPEPSTVALFGLAAAFAWYRCRRKAR